MNEIAETDKDLKGVLSPSVNHDDANEPQVEVEVGTVFNVPKDLFKDILPQVSISDPEGTPEDDSHRQDPHTQDHKDEVKPQVLNVAEVREKADPNRCNATVALLHINAFFIK